MNWRNAVLLAASVTGYAKVYQVGPDKEHKTIQTVPWEGLKPGDVVEIYGRPEPYRDKWYVAASGKPGSPITIRGMRVNGKRPVFEAANAVSRKHRGGEYNNEDRGVVRIGDLAKENKAQWIVVEGLEIRGARARVEYVATNGRKWGYEYNASGIYIEHGGHIVIRDCEIHENGDGIYLGSPVRPPDLSASNDILIENNYVHDNSYRGGGDQYHNLYLEGINVTIQYNHFGPPAGPEGNNLKDRSANTIIRYNWIEGGNRQLDLVESGHPLVIAAPGYGRAQVYGNVLIDNQGYDNDNIVNFGGDHPQQPDRAGPLLMYHNTLYSRRTDSSSFLRLSRADATADVRNNILWHTVAKPVKFTGGIVRESGNWMGTAPKLDPATMRPTAASAGAGKAVEIPTDWPAVDRQYKRQAGSEPRASRSDVGAFSQ